MPVCDVTLVLPHPFTDHPSFPEALLTRNLEAAGFSVSCMEAPNWQEGSDFEKVDPPRLFFAVVTGPVDSVVLNHTAAGKWRHEDLYQRGGAVYFPDSPASVSSRIRPDRAALVMAQRLRSAHRGVPVVLGGMEGDMRRFTHWDYVQKKLRRSLLLDARADVIVTGAGERTLVALARSRAAEKPWPDLAVPGTVWNLPGTSPLPDQALVVPADEEIHQDPRRLPLLERLTRQARRTGRVVAQMAGDRLLLELPQETWDTEALDRVYRHPFTRDLKGGGESPALTMNRFSLTAHRGCRGGCAFCSIAAHQGVGVVSRSRDSLAEEVARMVRHERWRGQISDVGGASAEMYGWDGGGGTDPKRYMELLRFLGRRPGVKQVLLGSGIRYDLWLDTPELLEELMREHGGSFLRVAPEHGSDRVLRWMNKPSFDHFPRFVSLFERINSRLRRPLRLAPYMVVGHPGEEARDVEETVSAFRRLRLSLRDVQMFTPSPGSRATALYVAGCDETGAELPVCRDIREVERRKNRLIEGTRR